MYDSSYEHGARGAESQNGQQQHHMPNGNAFNENYPVFYSQGTAAPTPAYYSTEMTRQQERRPLHPVQQEAPPGPSSLIGKIAQNTQRQQQMVHMVQYQGRPQPPVCAPPQPQRADRQPYPRYAAPEGPAPGHHVYSQPADLALSGQPSPAAYQQQQQRGYYQQPMQPAPFYADSLEAAPRQGLGQQQVYGRGMAMYTASPPSCFTAFTPMHTSSPLESNRAAGGSGYSAAGPAGPQGPQTDPHLWVQPPAPTPAKRPAIQQRAQPMEPHAARPQEKPSVMPSMATPRMAQAQAGPAASMATATAKTAAPARPPAPATPSAGAADASRTSDRDTAGRTRVAPRPAPERGLRVMTGSVDDILGWGRKLEDEARPNLHFEVIGSLVSLARGPMYSSLCVTLRSLQTSAALTVVFWEIDRSLSPPPAGSVVLCLCRMCPRRPQQVGAARRLPRMQLLSMRALSVGDVALMKRAIYVSSFCVQQGVLAAPPTAAAPARPAPAPSPLKQTLISQFAGPRARP